MKRTLSLIFLAIITPAVMAGVVRKTYSFTSYRIRQSGSYHSILLDQTIQAGKIGEPMLPYHQVALMLPPGERAVSIVITGSEPTPIPGNYQLFPQQVVQPLSEEPDGIFRKSRAIYAMNGPYPANPGGKLLCSVLNGYSFALSTFTPVIYNPVTGSLSYYKSMNVEVITSPDSDLSAAAFLSSSARARLRAELFAQNPEMFSQYPVKPSTPSDYEILIITPEQFQSGYQDLAAWYNGKNRPVQTITVETIGASVAGGDLQEKIRNCIIREYQDHSIDQVILGGDVEHVPYRGFYCHVISGSGYTDSNIPADIYYSALDGNWNSNGNSWWGEPGEDDLLPEISVGRMPFSTSQELSNMVHKSVGYQKNPVPGDFAKPLLVSEKLYDSPLTYGSDYLELLVDGHSDNGYTTYGIPSAQNAITKLYDAPGYSWTTTELLQKINAGSSFIHHDGHASSLSMMRLGTFSITNESFSLVNGVDHNYQLLYTHGCDCGAFNFNDCIAERSVTIANWLVAGVFNSRYGWFNQGTTEGPSPHLHREFISALYNPDQNLAITELGAAHTLSKIKTAPWIGLPGEFEPGAQRWVHYDCNVLGDPALKIWTGLPPAGIRLNLDVLLEGPYNGATEMMNNGISGHIPLTQPYQAAPWNYNGTESMVTVPSGVVDWVLVELRQATDPSLATSGTILAKRAALLRTDGTVVETDGITTDILFGNVAVAAGNSLFVIVRHRRHLAVMSATGAVLSGDVYHYDFTTGLNQAYGGGGGYKAVGSKFAMACGDIDQDGNIFVSDYNAWAAEFGHAAGYFNPDLDMDGNVYVSDFNKWAANFGSASNTIIKLSGVTALNRSKKHFDFYASPQDR